MKKLSIAAVVLASALALTACSTDAGTTSTKSDTASSAAKATQKPAGKSLTASQEQALVAAKNYLALGTGFSKQGLIDQLSSSAGSGFSVKDATVAVKAANVDYKKQAKLAAKAYLDLGTGFSHASMVEQLSSTSGNKFTPEQAEFGTKAVGL
ncbi:Ltp family lipoprotein [Frondihabitans sp. VKM Ac-2883]|uniref:Ltp family lipoprotein n=1 Tax=Frondihabitans sp. VKM Ac-2883 TaxID=2783823 RepID=UPI001E541532|nr:Ltp family lipoprotein [Frondihabitans sp. VKM Ac-2883]